MGLYIVDIVEVSAFIVGSTSHTDLVDILDLLHADLVDKLVLLHTDSACIL